MSHKQYKTKAHQMARKAGYCCARCHRSLEPAKYEGEFVYVFDEDGNDKMVSVYMRCRCGAINNVAMDVTDDDGFMDRVYIVSRVPSKAKKITEPTMAEEKT